jgi:predicted MFS family arabinose efflux permease
MPIAYAVGRRIVFLFSTVIVIVGAILCAKAQNYEWHLGARMLLGLAAGQSEALVPMITQVRRSWAISSHAATLTSWKRKYSFFTSVAEA